MIPDLVHDFYDEQMQVLKEKALVEREQLGLDSPEKITSYALIHPINDIQAWAKKNAICMNVILNTDFSMRPALQQAVPTLVRVTQKVEQYFGDFEKFIANPKDVYEKRKQESSYSKFADFKRVRGRSIENVFSHLNENIDDIRNIWNAYVDFLPQPFTKQSLHAYRHELEHVNHLQGPLGTTQADRRIIRYLQGQTIIRKLNQEESETLSTQKKVALQEKLYKEPIKESLAHAFSLTEINEIPQADFFILKEEIINRLKKNYEPTFTKTALDTLVSECWSKEEMNLSTSNTIYGVYEQIRQGKTTYPIDKKGTSKQIVNEVLKKTKQVANTYEKNIHISANATINAFMNNPKRINAAIYADSLKQYEQLCQHDAY